MRERAIKFLSTKLKTLPEEVLNKEVEEFILAESKKVSILCYRLDIIKLSLAMFWRSVI